MSKKRNRQQDPCGEPSEGSTESYEENSTGERCMHIPKAVNLNKIKKYINKAGITGECSACKKNEENSAKTDDEGTTVKPISWICLQCGNQGCSREASGHAIEHFQKPHSDCHFMVADTLRWGVWCYKCEAEVNANCKKKLQETVEYMKKFTMTVHDPPRTKTPTIQCQNETIEVDKDKDKIQSKIPKVRGLMNLGNTCFFNAVLQCLAQTPFLIKVLEDLKLPGEKFVLPGGKHKTANSSQEIDLPPIEGTLKRWGSFTSILCKTLVDMQTWTGPKTYYPSELFNSFKKKTMQCMDGGQHDSHELLRHLLELVRNEDLRRYQSIILKEVGLNEKTNPQDVEDSLKSRIKFYGNQASARLLGPELVFRGVLVSTLECMECHHTSQSTEPFLDLSLPVMAEKPQPPILKRKSSGLDESYDVDNRRKQMSSMYIVRNNIIAEIVGNPVESQESDADVEDNVEAECPVPEVDESGYSSEKQSALASPVSPSTNPSKTNEETVNGLPLNNYLPVSPTNAVLKLRDPLVPNSLQSSTNASMLDVDQAKDSSPEGSEGPIVGLDLLTSKERHGSSATGLTNCENSENANNSIPKIEPADLIAGKDDERSQKRMEEVYVELKNMVQRRRRRSALENNCSKEMTQCNGVNGITSGMSKIGISGNVHQSPTRYPTKEEECSIQSCLNQFTALELMSGSNKVGCETCTARERKLKETTKIVCTPSTKQYLISKVPAVLILHLKRIQAQRVNFRKVTKHVSFPAILNLAPACKGHDKSRVYALYGVVEHSGTIHGGHYVAYVKSRLPLAADDPRWSFLPSKDAKDTEEGSSSSSSDSGTEEGATLSSPEPPLGKWYYVSDSRAKEVDESTVLQSQAYLLFYERIL